MFSISPNRDALLGTTLVWLALSLSAAGQTNVPDEQDRFDAPRATRFALAGVLDVNRDGKHDGAVLRNLIELNGGSVDAEIDGQGNVIGQLHPETNYVIVGSPPSKDSSPPDVQKRFQDFLQRAEQLGIRVIFLDRLLGFGRSREEWTNGRDAPASRTPSPFRPRTPSPNPSRRPSRSSAY